MNKIDRETAERRLTNRYREQCLRFPTMRDDIPLDHYIATNVVMVMRNGLLASYDKAS